MEALIIENSMPFSKALCYKLLFFGIRGICVASIEDAFSKLDKHPDLELFFIDMDNKEINGNDILASIRKKRKKSQIVLDTNQPSGEVNRDQAKQGIKGILPKTFSEENMNKCLGPIISRIEFPADEKRKHIRIKPDPNELLRISFKILDHQGLLSGKILNISMGGVAIELLNPPRENVLKEGIFVYNVQFTLNFKPVNLKGQVVLFKENIAALRFLPYDGGSTRTIAEYILGKMNALT
jgi:CheY-like chemotaxis protein